MTSIEFIQNEIDNLEDLLENAKKDNCNVVRKECEEDIKQYNQVLKDLEVLEILKKAFLNNGVDVKPKCKKCFNLLELEPSEWLKFKYWLEG